MTKSVKNITAAILFAITALTAAASGYATVESVPNVHVADRTRYVSNPDGVLSNSAVTRIDSILATTWRATSAEPAVVVVDHIDPSTDIDAFATELFTRWGIGKSDKDNGLLVVVAAGDRRAVIRTGYGVEGVMPDIVAGRILRNVMFPRFREGDIDGGVIAAADTIRRVLTDPAYADELRSRQANDAHAKSPVDIDTGEIFTLYRNLCIFAVAACFIYVMWLIVSTRKRGSVERYNQLEHARIPVLFITFMSLGAGLIAWIPLWLTMRRIRRGPRKCPNCSTSMRKIDEEHDNDYLTPAQDTEERINSVDYDVWLCPQCNEVDILPFVNRNSAYTVCNNCGSRACSKVVDRVVVRPTSSHAGRGIKTFRCKNCGATHDMAYTIPRLAPPVIIAGGMGSGRGGGGLGGFGGGSFGGGMTGGGGASGGW